VAAFADFARTLGVWVLAGSQFLADADGAAVNRSLVFAPDGNIAARYDKIHMFDVTLPNGEVHAESQSYKPGTTASLVDVDGVRLGLSICYDMRFPAMYRALARAGAQVLSVPSAFTQVTGEAHWHVLLRARAIENGAYVLAPAQHGKHENGRQTFGHSLIVDPWGTVVAEAGNGDDFVMAELDMRAVDKARTALPVFDHGRGFSLSDTGEAVHD
jgi:predicted amidohydrolase